MAPLARRWLLTAALLCSLIAAARAGVVAVGKLQSCVNDGTTPTTSLTCSQKIVVTVELENNKIYETEQLNFGVSCVNSPTDQCPCPCNYATDANCACRDLRQNITVAATKSAVYASYPLTYVRNFNGRPYELTIVGTSCSDDWYDASATCGFAKLNGTDVMDSQGFCCRCPLINLGGGARLTRGDLQCNALSLTKAAHCLRLDPNWWHRGFTIGEYVLDFSIQLNITTVTQNDTNSAATVNGTASSGTAGSAVTKSEVLSITPAQPFLRDSSKRVSAKLLGDLESYQQAPQLDGKWLFIPQYPGEGPQEWYTRHFNEWMVVEDSMVTTTGLECDKIGVDYSGFRNSQPNACETPAGSCLRNQISDLYAADLQRINTGKEPLYFVGRYGGGTNNSRQMSTSLDASYQMRLSLNLPITAIKTSLLALSVAADDVAFVVSRSPAQILSVQLCTFDGVMCGGFQALATRGYLQVELKNAGYVAADYTVSVVGCSDGVRPIVAQTASIQAQSSRRFQFEVLMETDQATNSSCTFSVADSLGDVAAAQAISFYTNATEYLDNPDQAPLGPSYSGSGSQSADWCAQACPLVFNLKCAIAKGCYAHLAKGIAAMAGPAVGLGGLLFLWKSGYLSIILRILSFLFSCLFCRSQPAPAAAPAASKKASSGGRGRGRRQRRRREDTQEGVEEEEEEEGEESDEEGRGAAATRAPAQKSVAGKAAGKAAGSAKATAAAVSMQGDAVVAVAQQAHQQQQAQQQQQAPPAATEPPPAAQARLRRRRTSSLSRAKASILSAAQQAKDAFLGLRQIVINNPLAAGQDGGEAGSLLAPQAPASHASPTHPPPVLPRPAGGPAGQQAWSAPGSPVAALHCPVPAPSPTAAYAAGMQAPWGAAGGGLAAGGLAPQGWQQQAISGPQFGAAPAAGNPGGGAGGNPAAVAALQQQLAAVQQQIQALRAARMQAGGAGPPAPALPPGR